MRARSCRGNDIADIEIQLARPSDQSKRKQQTIAAA
jgi:hypothetical protein